MATSRRMRRPFQLPRSYQPHPVLAVASAGALVSRVMSKWKREGIIDSGRRWTAIVDEDALADLAM
ncbi:helix-turn-helix domain-containing protein [Corynebacterium vitaeruminis]|uniref:helix-turn-helix domain-containing protein n=1 Tax=Corynebacterium vitaeruminis TaxID=38305 RepID=UPI001955235A|nr:helix-turn-helix domain-containing protein [Corynebacterium vitaeruminis]